MKITEEIQKRMDNDEVIDNGDGLYMFQDACVGLVYDKKNKKINIPEPELYINVQPLLSKKDMSKKIFKYKTQYVRGEFIIEAIDLIYGIYKKDIILKFGVNVEVEVCPMWCIIQTVDNDYEFAVAPFHIGDDGSDYDFFDIEENQTTKINYKRTGIQI